MCTADLLKSDKKAEKTAVPLTELRRLERYATWARGSIELLAKCGERRQAGLELPITEEAHQQHPRPRLADIEPGGVNSAIGERFFGHANTLPFP